MSLWRLLAIIIAALTLASCRAIPEGMVSGPSLGSRQAMPSTASLQGPSDASEVALCSVELNDEACPGCHLCQSGTGHACHPGFSNCRHPQYCGPSCAPMAVIPPPQVPVAEFCTICDGGDHGRRAKPEGIDRIDNLTAGDTVARWDATGMPGDEPSGSQITVSNCACVCAPKFASIREVLRPYEEFGPSGPVAVVRDEGLRVSSVREKIRSGTQRIPLEVTRLATPELAVVETVPPVSAERPIMPAEAASESGPAERVSDEPPRFVALPRRPKVAIGFDVPLAWTCLAQAMVTINDTTAEVVSIEEGVATLRLRTPGRPELTLCKTAGSNTARSGEELDFTIALYNSGDRTLERITLVDALPKRLAFIPESADATLPFDFSTETGDDGATVLKWVFRDSLPPGASGFVRFRTVVR